MTLWLFLIHLSFSLIASETIRLYLIQFFRCYYSLPKLDCCLDWWNIITSFICFSLDDISLLGAFSSNYVLALVSTIFNMVYVVDILLVKCFFLLWSRSFGILSSNYGLFFLCFVYVVEYLFWIQYKIFAMKFVICNDIFFSLWAFHQMVLLSYGCFFFFFIYCELCFFFLQIWWYSGYSYLLVDGLSLRIWFFLVSYFHFVLESCTILFQIGCENLSFYLLS